MGLDEDPSVFFQKFQEEIVHLFRIHPIDDFHRQFLFEHAPSVDHHLSVGHASGDIDVDDIFSFFGNDRLVDHGSRCRIVVGAAGRAVDVKEIVAALDVFLQFLFQERTDV